MTTMPRLSAGLLMYRIKDGVLQVLLAHPGEEKRCQDRMARELL
jgi:predicted NUDIX family NTP pyrophosphohydrolase